MKRLMLILIAFAPCIGHAHSRADFDNAMDRFVRCYNNRDAKGICSLFSDSWGKQKKLPWNQKELESTLKEYGKIISYKYVSIDSVSDQNRITLYKVVAEHKTFMLGFDLDDKHKFGTHRFDTRSPHIDSLLSAAK